MEEIRYKEILEEKDSVIASLIESNDCLQEEVTRLRASNRILRTVHKVLRERVNSLMRQVELSHFNDETFKKFCEGEFDAKYQTETESEMPSREMDVRQESVSAVLAEAVPKEQSSEMA